MRMAGACDTLQGRPQHQSEGITAGSVVLDLGSGDGILLVAAAKRGARAVGEANRARFRSLDFHTSTPGVELSADLNAAVCRVHVRSLAEMEERRPCRELLRQEWKVR
eukprot:170344-Hanusia_phi.AAC.1